MGWERGALVVEEEKEYSGRGKRTSWLEGDQSVCAGCLCCCDCARVHACIARAPGGGGEEVGGVSAWRREASGRRTQVPPSAQ